ncbi:hypothetical protein HU200_055426 [Digitaria exilis]|uniref:PB1 domain-containing protein n=1 Tax=Digitaria exilis TaxID=1010633 RepID=A0A835AI44_9POAL|nr:hypothetical protein HU200_055426 [Digitaria exilis]CAB3472283.1 unnamed protein product [Digitaria exilis]
MEPVPPAMVAGVGAPGPGPGPGYPESTESSPRSRGGDSWDEPFPSSAAAAAAGGGGRLRLMCSFGGRIVPRPTDKSLCYLGGETRIVAVDRHASLADVHARLSRSLLGGRPFTLKYQLPNEDLDSLISVSTDEDLDNLVDEYDRIAAGSSSGGGSSRTSRIRLFLFPAKPESSSSLGSLLDDSSKSENWFVDALNSAISGSLDGIPRGISTDSASVNCLLGLEDDSSVHSRSGVPNSAPSEDQRAAQQKLPAAATAAAVAGRHPHDVQSVPDSPMLDKNSSFGSTSSAPSLSNLPPIRVRPADRPQDSRVMPPATVEDHFAQMGISEQQPPPPVAYMQPPQQVPIPAMAVPVASPSEASSRVFSDDDRSDHGGSRKPQPPKQEVPTVADPTNRAVYYNDRSPPAELKRDMPVGAEAASYRLPVSTPDAAAVAAAAAATQPPPGYVFAQMHAPPPQQQPPPPQPPQQPQQPAPQQIVTAGNQHFIHNPATGTFIPIQSYYHHPVPQQAPQPVARPQQAPAFDPNTGMYYIPMQQNAPQPYSMPPGAQASLPPASLVDTTPKPTVPIPQMAVKPELQQVQQPGVYRTTAAPAPAPAPNAAPGYAGMGYHHVIQSHHHPVQQPVANMAGNYGYEYADPTRAQQQVYYSQAAPQPTLPPQYQPIVSPDAGQAEKH